MHKFIRYAPYYLFKATAYPMLVRRALQDISGIGCAIKDPQEEYLKTILQSSIRSVPAYQTIIWDNDASGRENLQKFPVVKRSDLQKAPKNYRSTSPSAHTAFNTSGSTGDPLKFLRDIRASIWDDAHQISTYRVMGFQPGDRIVIFSGYRPSQAQAERGVYWYRKSLFGEYPFGSYQLSANDLNRQTIRKYHSFLKAIRPAIIRGYPSALYSLATLLEEFSLSASFPIKGVLLSSENIYSHQAEKISQILRAPVYRQYGHSECAVFAMSKPDHCSYRVSPWYGFVEFLDEDEQHVPSGGTGRIVVTGYHNIKQPFIRYDTGDIGTSGGSIGGVQIIEQLIGRSQDYLVTRDGAQVPITSIVSGSHLKINEYVTKWRLIQESPNFISAQIQADERVPEDCIKEIRAVFSPYVDLRVVYVDSIPKSSSGKSAFFTSKL